ncbi:MAG: hypothetical protein ACI396_02810, partial [Acutalibacteraceae bacterium]
MKRFVAFIIAMIMTVTIFSSCGSNIDENAAQSRSASAAATTVANATAAKTTDTNASPLIYCDFTVQNKWESNDGKYTQLKVTVHNNADFDIESWSASAKPLQSFSITDKWGLECGYDG